MANIQDSARLYEDWLRNQLRGDVVETDLDRKHDKMKESAFVFLRATYWRWAETILDICPDLGRAPPVLAVGDIHLENYGTWRDIDGRLAWGVNDFDEAAEMPYVLDLVRLAASALLGRTGNSMTAEEICAAILLGYGQGLQAPKPIVLDRDNQWLRDLVVVPEKQRSKFWKKLAAAKAKPAPPHYRKALARAMPEASLALKFARRSAGTGSLGRPRWVGIADWRGAPVVREAKALLMSAWWRESRGSRKIRCGDIANGRFRAPDPWFRIDGTIAVRRLSPNNRKIEVEDNTNTLLVPDMLRMMGFELANTHFGTMDRRTAVSRDLTKRKRGWLSASTKIACEAITRDYTDWKSR
jgi:hypothetical protein